MFIGSQRDENLFIVRLSFTAFLFRRVASIMSDALTEAACNNEIDVVRSILKDTPARVNGKDGVSFITVKQNPFVF